jgi:hypothetical protein
MIDMSMKPASPVNMLADVNPEPRFPEGMRFEVTGEKLRALGFGDTTLPQVNDEFTMHCRVKVIEVCKEDGIVEQGYCVGFQITAMELAGADDVMNEQQAAYANLDKLYG